VSGISGADAARQQIGVSVPPSRPLGILVLCTGNSARSQIAEALLATHGKGRVDAASAGSRPAPRVNPLAIEVLRRHGITWQPTAPKRIGEFDGRRFDLVIIEQLDDEELRKRAQAVHDVIG
jgi:protein-tyrosine-phosphatase